MIYDLMIIGGGPAGLSAGLYAARARLSAAVLTDGGGQVTSTSEIENYLGIENIDGFELDRLFTEHAVKMGAKIIRGRAEALSDGGEIKTIKTRDGELSARAVILAMGATHRELGLESERRLFGSGVSYCATCDGAFFPRQNRCGGRRRRYGACRCFVSFKHSFARISYPPARRVQGLAVSCGARGIQGQHTLYHVHGRGGNIRRRPR